MGRNVLEHVVVPHLTVNIDPAEDIDDILNRFIRSPLIIVRAGQVQRL